MERIIIEIPPLGAADSYYLQERYKPCFNYPLHKHEALELNFVENCRGARRLVGDSMEVLGDYDLVLVGSNLEHVWEQHKCAEEGNVIHEITIQIPVDLFPPSVLERRVMAPLKELLDNSRLGLAFGMKAIMTVYGRLQELTQMEPSFRSLSMMNEILFDLAGSHDYRVLSSSRYSHVEMPVASGRVQKIKQYIDSHYAEEIRISTLADMVSMTPNALSRFFKQHTNRSISDYINDVRMGHASEMLIDSMKTVVEVCYECGFNTISNFNRIFKARKGCTPSEFRDSYRKNTIVI